ncbi:2-hydroxychromene-2-carboxylate isomerase [Noviherbaspirillum galbum]|uniref:2-hydroxychromene-2-carboxylate isomerase n=1 Tax=Noviherbaspirillum galbum TaxID=2709383 RepID=A0A6B3SWB6_9BURK|nr:2-hydroxychromene-2-carboxylate isomerase [Noviherbaspirillum galbum]NEX63236.1 2-hydroxychromene-2-carboxylate isomerase [Noviherbaspirillum galbum]
MEANSRTTQDRTIAWYFDFISPFSYLQSELLPTLPQDVRIDYKPVLFAGLLNHWDNKGPAEIAPKRLWTFEHCAWLAHKHGIPMRPPAHHPFNPLPLLRLCIALGSSAEVVRRLFRFVWREGHLPAEEAHWQALLAELRATTQMLDSPDVKLQLRNNGEQAIAAGVFGVPTAVVDQRCFWGLDATDMLVAYLGGDPFFGSELLRQAQTLPQGTHRKTLT